MKKNFLPQLVQVSGLCLVFTGHTQYLTSPAVLVVSEAQIGEQRISLDIKI